MRPLHGGINEEPHEKHLYNPSSHYRKCTFLIIKAHAPAINQNRGCVAQHHVSLLFILATLNTLGNKE